MLSRMRTCVLVVAALLAAAPLGAQEPPSPAALPSIALPPALDRVLRDYERDWKARDGAALAMLFAEDGFILQPGRPPVRGREAIRARYARQAGGELRLRALAASASDTTGYIIGAYGDGDATGDTPGDMGKFTLTLRRAPGGAWLICSDMDNPSQPPRRVGPPPPSGP